MRVNVILLLMILSVASAYATIDVRTYDASLDFSVFTLQNSNICSCAQAFDDITLTNTGSFSAIFSITSDAKLSEYTLELKPGESRIIKMFFDPDCAEKTKTYTTTIKSNLGPEKTIEKTVKSEKCQNLELWLTPTEKIKACEEARYTVFIKNSGLFTEEYSMKSNSDKYMTYSANYFTLNPSQIAVVNASLKFPCDVSGLKNIEFSAYAVKNKLNAKIKTNLDITSDYDFNFNILGVNASGNKTQLDVCNRVWIAEYPIIITNNGIENEFTISAKDIPGFARLSDEKIFLTRGESKTVYLRVDTHEFRQEVKSYGFSLIAKPKIGSEQSKDLLINTKPCYELDMSIIEKSSDKLPISICAKSFNGFDINIKNNGIYKETVTLSLDGAPSGVDLSRTSLSLGPGETDMIKLYVQGPETNYIYNIQAIAKLSNGISESKSLWIKTYDKQTCHNIEFEKSRFNVNYDYYYVEVPVRSVGLYPDTYELSISNNSFAKLAEKKVFINDSTKIRIDIDSLNKTEGNYDVKITAKHNASGAKYENDITITLKDKSPIRKAYEYFFYGTQCRQISFWMITAIIIVCILIILIMIFGPHYQYRLSNRIRLKLPILIVLLAIFIIAVALVLILADRPKPTNEIYGINTSIQDLRFEILTNEKYALDVSSFFSDPDKNSLRYEVSEIKDVKTYVDKNIITLSPDYGWFGTRNFTVTAFDEAGESVKSPDMTLKVIDVPRKTFLQLYDVYCYYTNLLILFILLLLIFIVFIIKQKKRGR